MVHNGGICRATALWLRKRTWSTLVFLLTVCYTHTQMDNVILFSGSYKGTAPTEGITPMSTKDQQISKENFQRTTHPDAQWFGEAGFGLFIHWGICSAHGGIDLSWGMVD